MKEFLIYFVIGTGGIACLYYWFRFADCIGDRLNSSLVEIVIAVVIPIAIILTLTT